MIKEFRKKRENDCANEEEESTEKQLLTHLKSVTLMPTNLLMICPLDPMIITGKNENML